MHRAQIQSLQPKDLASWQKYKQIIEPAWNRTFHLESSRMVEGAIEYLSAPANADYAIEEHKITRHGEDTGLKVLYFTPSHTHSPAHKLRVLLVDARGSAAFCDTSGAPKGLARKLLDKHFKIAVLEDFPKVESRDETSIMFNTYNRTRLQTQVRNLITVCEEVGSPLVLCGTGRAGLWCLLAAPAAGAVIADCDQLDVSDDQNLLAPDLFCPGLRNIDTFAGAATLNAPRCLLLHNVAGNFPIAGLRAAYKALKAQNNFQSESHRLTDDQIVGWISRLE